MKSKTKVVNICGGPGVGKSTIASGIFSELKRRQISCELVSEYAKEVTWEETHKLLENQIHIFAEQFRRQWRLVDKVAYIVTDSPLILNSIYYDYYLKRLQDEVKFSDEYVRISRQFFDKTFLEFNNINIYIERYYEHDIETGDVIYPTFEQSGRNQTIEEALDIDFQIRVKLAKYDPEYLSTCCTRDTDSVVKGIADYLAFDVKKEE